MLPWCKRQMCTAGLVCPANHRGLGDSNSQSTQGHSRIDHLDPVQEFIFLWLYASLAVATYQGRVFPVAVGVPVPLCNSENSKFLT